METEPNERVVTFRTKERLLSVASPTHRVGNLLLHGIRVHELVCCAVDRPPSGCDKRLPRADEASRNLWPLHRLSGNGVAANVSETL